MEGMQITAPFTSREIDILGLVARCYTRSQISQYLGICYKTVDAHMNHISIKTGCRGYAALVRYAQDRGYGLKISGARTTEPLSPDMLVKPTQKTGDTTYTVELPSQ